jgi:hypothetical protein
MITIRDAPPIAAVVCATKIPSSQKSVKVAEPQHPRAPRAEPVSGR